MTQRWYGYLLASIVAVALALRIVALGSVPAGLYWDEQAMLADAASVVAQGTDVHGNHWLQAMFPSYGDYKLPVYIWVTSIVVRFTGVVPWAVRIPSVLAGIGTVILAAELARLLLRRYAQVHRTIQYQSALAVAAVVALSPWTIHFSRTGFEGHLAQFLVLASAYVLVRFQSKWGLIASAVIGAMATYSYFSVRFVWPLVIVALLVLEWLQLRSSIKRAVTHLGIVMVVFGLCLIPLFTSRYYQPSQQFRLSTESLLTRNYAVESNQFREYAGNTFVDRVLFHRSLFLGRDLARNTSDHLNFNYLFTTGDPNPRHSPAPFGLFVLPLLVAFVFGWWKLFEWSKSLTAVIVIWWLAALIPAVVPVATPHALRSLNAVFPLVFVIGTGLAGLWSWTAQQKTVLSRIIVGLLAAAIAFFTIQFLSYYFAIYPDAIANHWQAGFDVAAQKISQAARDVDQVYVDPFDNRFYLWFWTELPIDEVITADKPNYQSQQLRNISFQGLQWQELAAQKNILIVGPVDYIEANQADFDISPVNEQTIEDTNPALKLIWL